RTLYGPLQGTLSSANGAGALRTFGEHKGSGLALLCELFGGALTGGGCAGPGPRTFANGMLSIYFGTAAFGDRAEVGAEVLSFVDYVKAARPAVAGEAVLLPGEPERQKREDRLAHGVPLEAEVWRTLEALARPAGVDIAAVLACSTD